MATHSSYRDLRIWQEAVDLALQVYRVTTGFPKHELYGLSSQMRRAAVSVASNIAEGKGRNTDRDFGKFLFQARGSLLELQTQIAIARGLEYLPEQESSALSGDADALGRGLNGLIQAVHGSKRTLANSERRTANDD